MRTEIDSSILEYLKSLTLLCVEDNKTTQLIYSSIFEDIVEKIIFADNGEEGYQTFTKNKIDIIISDYTMPILNGIAMIEKIRQKNKDIPIILVTAIQEIDVIVKALQLNVNNFLSKPIITKNVIEAIEKVTKILIANNYLKEQNEMRVKALEDKNKYSTYQEDLAFSKELNIIRNDFYFHMIDSHSPSLMSFFYKPLDVVSGDAYSARKIDDCVTFYLIVDGMGKGLSASLSAMLMTSYINHQIDLIINDITAKFDMYKLIKMSLEYIKPILLAEEALAIDYITINHKDREMEYAKFAMPAIMMQTEDEDIVKLKSNNQPISKYIRDFNISTYNTSNIIKFLFFSDGIVENETKIDKQPYSNYIEDDFINSFSKEDMAHNFLNKIENQEDDITFLFITHLNLNSQTQQQREFDSTLDELEVANSWYAGIWSELTDNGKLRNDANIVFTELYMNAYEHGNLDIDSHTKHKLLDEDTYFETLNEIQKDCNKKITVTVYIIEFNSHKYVVTKIADEGDGFNTGILEEIFKESNSFNGRGVYVSKKSSMGIYYNKKGNSVLFLHKI